MTSYTYQPDVTFHNGRAFGLVLIKIGTKIQDTQLIRLARKDKEEALSDASKRVRELVAFGINTPINLNDYM